MGNRLGLVLQRDRHLTHSHMVNRGDCVLPQSCDRQHMPRRCVDDYAKEVRVINNYLLIEWKVVVVSIRVLKLKSAWSCSFQLVKDNHFLLAWSNEFMVCAWQNDLMMTTATETS